MSDATEWAAMAVKDMGSAAAEVSWALSQGDLTQTGGLGRLTNACHLTKRALDFLSQAKKSVEDARGK